MKLLLIIMHYIVLILCQCTVGKPPFIANAATKDEVRVQNPNLNSDFYICEAFIHGYDYIVIYDIPNGNVIGRIRNDIQLEIYYGISVIKINGTWFYIRAEYGDITITGWINNKNQLATYSRNYSDTLFVYNTTESKEIVHVIPYYLTTPMLVIDCKKDWVKVEFYNQQIKAIGWVSKSMTCSNPYSTCP